MRQLIERHAAGRSFVDVGCMWNVDGAYAFHAFDRGATQVTGIDLLAATEAFVAENARRGSPVTIVQGDVNDPALTERLGKVDVVFCSGVLYHVPNPVATLQQLRALCRETLILGSATIRERRTPQTAVYYPFLDARARGRMTYRTPHLKVGLDTAMRDDWLYANWFWGLTPSCVQAMLRTAGFEPFEVHHFRHAVCVVAGVT